MSTPSTDGAPDPADVIARILYVSEMWKDGRLHTGGYDDLAPQHAKILQDEARQHILDPLAAAGLRVVPEDRPTPCDCERFGFKVPGHTVGSNWDWVPCPEGHGPRTLTDDEALVATLRAECIEFHAADGITDDCAYVHAADRIIELAAGVPALDDDTRREVEHLREGLQLIAEATTIADAVPEVRRLAAAYLGGTDGR